MATKLNNEQIEQVESYLLDWELQYRDFYDEMLDHFCLEIESKLDLGFEEAFAQTTHLFAEYEFTVNKNISWLVNETTYHGVKAMEMERAVGMQNFYQKQYWQEMKKQILSWRVLVWGMVFFVFYTKFSQGLRIELHFPEGKGFAFLNGFLMGFFLPFTISLFMHTSLRNGPLEILGKIASKMPFGLRKIIQLFRKVKISVFFLVFLRYSTPVFIIALLALIFEFTIPSLIVSLMFTLGIILLVISSTLVYKFRNHLIPKINR